MQIEYKIIDSNTDGNPDSEYELNELGKDGWELCAIMPQVNTVRFFFKRFVTTIYFPEQTPSGSADCPDGHFI